MRVLAVIASVVLLAITARLIGAQALTAGFTALGPVSVLAAAVLGFAATGAQALRWHLLAAAGGIRLGLGRALADCYASSFANMVLPGGLAGDAVRAAVYRDRGRRRWLSPLLAVGAERLSATTLLFAAAAVILALVNMVLMTALSTLFAFLYNIGSTLVGGFHLKLTDD